MEELKKTNIPEEAAKILEIRKDSDMKAREVTRKFLKEAVELAYKAGTDSKDVRCIKHTLKTVLNVMPSDKEWLLKEYNFELRWDMDRRCQIILPSEAILKELVALQDAQDREING